jgi:hypothetical protein
MSAANRRRGADAERSVVRWLRDNGYPDARRVLAGDGRQDSDVTFHPLVSLEAKDVASSAWPTWCRQAVAQSHPGTIPVVVRRTRGVPAVAGWRCRFRYSDLAEYGFEVVCSFGHQDDGDLWVELPFGAFIAALKRLDGDA